jgi:CBS domain-containing protein
MTTVWDICNRSPRVTTPDASLAEAAKTMWDADCGALPVCDASRKVAGMITDRDIAMMLALKGAKGVESRVRDAMRGPLTTCQASDRVGEALSKMAEAQVRRLPVVSADGAIMGVFSIGDAFRASGKYFGPKGADLEAPELVRVMQAILESPDSKKTISSNRPRPAPSE